MEQPAHAFVRRLMAEVLRLHRIPKVQVERIVGPILGLFLPDVVGPLLGDACEDVTGFEVVSPEFPLKKAGNKQSTNIDWLVIHRRLGLIVLLELKTAVGSIEHDQLDTYEEVRQRVLREGGSFLMDDVRQIRRASFQGAKYEALLDTCAPYEAALSLARRAETVCLVPAGTTIPTGAPRIVRHFRDLPTSIDGELAAEWALIRDALCGLERPATVAPASLPQPPANAVDFAVRVVENLRRQGESRTPVRFWIGDTGSGLTPNYQVEFSDGSVQTYHHSGVSHRAPSFKTTNLRGPFGFAE